MENLKEWLLHRCYQDLNLEDVEYLCLAKNDLDYLPKEIFFLNNLIGLDLYQNRLTDIPEDIFKLENLERIDLRGNELSEESKDILKKLEARGVEVYL